MGTPNREAHQPDLASSVPEDDGVISDLNGDGGEGTRGWTPQHSAGGRVELGAVTRAVKDHFLGIEEDRAAQVCADGIEGARKVVVQAKDDGGPTLIEGSPRLIWGYFFTSAQDEGGGGFGFGLVVEGKQIAGQGPQQRGGGCAERGVRAEPQPVPSGGCCGWLALLSAHGLWFYDRGSPVNAKRRGGHVAEEPTPRGVERRTV